MGFLPVTWHTRAIVVLRIRKGRIIRYYLAEFQAEILPDAERRSAQRMPQMTVSQAIQHAEPELVQAWPVHSVPDFCHGPSTSRTQIKPRSAKESAELPAMMK